MGSTARRPPPERRGAAAGVNVTPLHFAEVVLGK
jgi:hypothetical protein